jgi:hypothetical protein
LSRLLHSDWVKFARITFPSREVAVKAYYELARRGRVVSLPNGEFIVPEPAVKFLEQEGLAHEVHEWLSGDHVTQTLRDPLAHSV